MPATTRPVIQAKAESQDFLWIFLFFRGCFQKRSLVQDRGGRRLETGGIVGYFEDFKASPTKILGQGTFWKHPLGKKIWKSNIF